MAKKGMNTMSKKIGFIDYYLDEWHANNYPAWIEKASNGEYTVAYAYGEIDSPLGGRTTEQWCKDMGVEHIESMDEIIEKSDVLILLSPDNPEMHWPLCQKPLRAGKRIYVDKTFAPTAQIARDLFKLAEDHNTPMFSSSALRFAKELSELPEKEVRFVLLGGPGNPSNYLIHQIEPMVQLIKENALRVMYNGVAGAASYTVEFENGKMGVANLLISGPFQTTVKFTDDSVVAIPESTETFDRLIPAMINFFETGEVPVDGKETVIIAEILEAAHKAEETPGKWIDIR